jgi:hypothetical protein
VHSTALVPSILRASRWWAAAALALLMTPAVPARAGGPLGFTMDGAAHRWSQSYPVRYVVDSGPLGPRSHTAAVALMDRTIQTWQGVPTARLQIQAAGRLSRDIDGSDVLEFLDNLRADSLSPILFDHDSSITEELLGYGGAAAGFATPWIVEPGGSRILVSFAVLNGPTFEDTSDDTLVDTAVHEIGHFLGLDHTQLNAEQQFDGDPANDDLAPVMSYARGPNASGKLHRDDSAWFSWLYPSPEFAGGTGTIRGRVLLPDGVTGLQGVNVIARRVGDPEVTAVSVVSGYLFGGVDEGVRDPARMGEFLIPGLPPGAYTLEIDQLDSSPRVRVRHAFLPGGRKFWREGSSAQDRASDVTAIVVNAGQEAAGIDVLANGERLGEPGAVEETEPNELPEAQTLTLPAVISGALQGGARPLIEGQEDLHDVYRVTLREWTTVTAILSAARSGADLDLNVLYLDGGRYVALAESTDGGTPPETIQLHLPPGRFYFGVHQSGTRASAYTLRLMATPAPVLDDEREYAWINYLIVGDVTPTGATLRWQTTADSPAVVYYGDPLREIGSTTRRREQTLTLTGLTPGNRTNLYVYASSPAGVDEAVTTVTGATSPEPDGEPRLVAASRGVFIDWDLAEVVVRLTNAGDGDALKVRIDQVTPAVGWKLLSELYTTARLPEALEVGGVGTGGAGALVLRLVRIRGDADPKVTVRGSYTNAKGEPRRF